MVFAMIAKRAGKEMTYSYFSGSDCADLESSLDKVCILVPIWHVTAHTSYSSDLIINFGTGRDTRLSSHPSNQEDECCTKVPSPPNH